MRAILVDSDVLIEVSRARDQLLVRRWNELSESEVSLLCSPINFAELWHGVRPHEEQALTALFASMVCVPIDGTIGRRAGEYMRAFAKSHRIEMADALIAATAAIHKVELWTRNRRHYPMKDFEFA